MVIDIQQKGVEYRVHSVLDHFGREQIEEVVCQNQGKNICRHFTSYPKPHKNCQRGREGKGNPLGPKPNASSFQNLDLL